MALSEYYGEKRAYGKVSRGRLDGILRLAGNLDGKTVLDIGCGTGELGRALKERFRARVYGVDISSHSVERARELLDDAIVRDIEHDDLSPVLRARPYDAVIASEVLEHLFSPEVLLEKIRRAYEGPVIITVPNVLFWRNRLRILLGHFEYEESGLMDRGHIHFFSWRGFQDTIREAGYRISGTAHVIPTRGTTWLGGFFPGLFARQFVVRISPDNKP